VDKYSPKNFTQLLSPEKINREVLKAMKKWDPFVFKSAGHHGDGGDSAEGGGAGAGAGGGGGTGSGSGFGAAGILGSGQKHAASHGHGHHGNGKGKNGTGDASGSGGTEGEADCRPYNKVRFTTCIASDFHILVFFVFGFTYPLKMSCACVPILSFLFFPYHLVFKQVIMLCGPPGTGKVAFFLCLLSCIFVSISYVAHAY
jgi:hypothetical protein